MSVTPLRPILRVLSQTSPPTLVRRAAPTLQGFILQLMQSGRVDSNLMMAALARQTETDRHIFDLLLARQAITAEALYDAAGQYWSLGVVDLQRDPPDPRLLAETNVVRCLHLALVPWRKIGEVTVLVSAYPDHPQSDFAEISQHFGEVVLATAAKVEIEAALHHLCGQRLSHRAETMVAAGESCRQLQAARLRRPALLLASVFVLVTLIAPFPALCGLFILAVAALFAFAAMKLAVLAVLARPSPPPRNAPVIARLPKVSILVALYRESDIAGRLTARLDQLDYPRDLLEVLLIVEAEDQLTRRALACADLPGWMRVITVPDGSVKTKPRALNYALEHCQGAIIGIYDAEDAPEVPQIRKVVQRFHEVGRDVACLQGILDFYNPASNWLARCFTIEYAAWFRVFLPGIERLGLAIPLGGTTVFLRRSVLEELGGWDAQNVTEDADLGLRLARHGYRTELIDTVTFEEANCRSLPWVKQRSRWIKGYMMTWLCHMRDPALLWRQLGPRRFVGFQIQFFASILNALLAPLLWSFWLTLIGMPHPVVAALSPPAFVALYLAMAAVQLLSLGFDLIGLRRTQHRLSLLWLPLLPLYHMLATLAAYKALWELLTRPFYWDKTSHGHFDT